VLDAGAVDSESMWKRVTRQWPALALFGLLAVGFAAVETNSPRPVLGVVMFGVGAALASVGLTRIINPSWRQQPWWRDRPLFRFAFSWKRAASPTNAWSERAEGLWQLARGLAFAGAGVLTLL
jgi:hypothetical protein